MTERIVGPLLPELRAIAVDLGLRFRMKKRSNGVITDDILRRDAKAFREGLAKSADVPPHVSIDETRIGDCGAEWVRVGESDGSKVVLYFHGGGFFMSSPALHRPLTWRIARATSRPVLAVDYRMAPDHAFPAWLDDGIAAYSHLLAQGLRGEDILIAGDSAGGNIALSLTHRIRREKLPMPEGLILLSPWADLLCQGRSHRWNYFRDAMFDARGVRAVGRYLTRNCNPYDPEISPMYGDFRGFPKMLLFAGSTEVFLDDARTVTRRAKAAGVDVALYTYRHMPHVFPIFSGMIPRAKTAFDTITAFAGSNRAARDASAA